MGERTVMEKARDTGMEIRQRADRWVKNRYVCGEQLAYDYDIGRWGK